MARPHPVVGIASELSERCWRCTNETHVGVGLRNDEIINIVIVEAGHSGAAMRIVGLGLLLERVYHCVSRSLGDFLLVLELLALLESLIVGLVEGIGDVCHTLKEGNGQTFCREFLLVGHCPVSVFEIVVLWT